MLHPKNYLESCTALLGYKDVIDHDPGYVSPHEIENSSLVKKIEKVYRWERRFVSGPYFDDKMDRIQDPTSFVFTKKPSDWIEMAFEDRLYGDEMECG